ncbi:Formin-like protein [Actinidia chinensis var. chinensis]|uniref:Formin-like protein n=1 Tax=Actinidia chinensis var. chinensis TaxID=1590841 RepID=A0A2R6QTH8_ACTCC|nr:Formin-like protein [Actinidia chinensis var. chinensis]
MGGTRVRFVIVLLGFLFALVVVRSEGNRRILGTLFGNEVPWISQHTADQVWIHCRKEMEDCTEAVQDFELYLLHAAGGSYNEINPEVALLTRSKLEGSITYLPPQAKQILLSCLRRNNCPLYTSGNVVDSSAWFKKCLNLLFGWLDVPRRYLQSDHKKARSLAPASAPAPGPTHARARFSLAPASSPSPISQRPAKPPKPPLPKKPHASPPPPKVKPSPLHFVPAPPPQNNSDSQKDIIIAVVATAAVLLTLFAVIFVCFIRRNSNKVGPKDGQRDEKPLLNFCSSDMSGASHKSHSVGNSSNKDFNVVNNLSVDSHGSSLVHAQSSECIEGASGTSNGALPLPPGRTVAPPPGPPPPPPKPPAPKPPPPPKAVRPPPVPLAKPSPLGPHRRRPSSSSGGGDDLTGESDSQKTKLKAFFWDKVVANPDHSMVWHELKAGSFQVNEEMMETLFGYTAAEKTKNERRKESSSFDSPPQYIQIIDAKKSQNLAILLKALNVTTEEVCDALKEGNELPAELIQTLLKMAPTSEEELKLRLFSGDLSQLGPAERFLKVMVEIPFAFKRLESLLFMSSLQEEVFAIKESFETLEVACMELKNSRLFLKLLEAVLKTGNRMNDGTFRGGAQAFKLDTLLKLSDVKGTDGKTTLLHFVVQEIIRSEGIRAARTARESQSMKMEDLAEDSVHETAEYYRSLGLQLVSGLSNDLGNVRKAALIDTDSVAATVSKLGALLLKTREFVNNEMKSFDEESKFHDSLANFVKHAENEITSILEEEKRIMSIVKKTVDYFHGNAGKEEGLRLFVVVRDFLIILDKVCKEVRNSAAMPSRTPKRETSSTSVSSESRQPTLPDVRQRLFPAIMDRRMDDFSSDDESLSP